MKPHPGFQAEDAGAKEAGDVSGRALQPQEWQVLWRTGNKETEHRGTPCRSLYGAVDPSHSLSFLHMQWSIAKHSAVITSVSENSLCICCWFWTYQLDHWMDLLREAARCEGELEQLRWCWCPQRNRNLRTSPWEPFSCTGPRDGIMEP